MNPQNSRCLPPLYTTSREPSNKADTVPFATTIFHPRTETMTSEPTIYNDPTFDAVDRFFTFTESFLCGPDHATSNVQLDPAALEREEARPIFGWGNKNAVGDGSSNEGKAFCEATELCGVLGCHGGSDDHNGKALESEGSVVSNYSKDSTSRRRRFWAFLRCNGRHKENDVIH